MSPPPPGHGRQPARPYLTHYEAPVSAALNATAVWGLVFRRFELFSAAGVFRLLNDSHPPMPTSRSVSRAIARSRAIRASAVRRRRRRVLLAACIATIAGAPIAWFMAEPAAAVVASAASEARGLA